MREIIAVAVILALGPEVLTFWGLLGFHLDPLAGISGHMGRTVRRRERSAVLYLRVGTRGQDIANQRAALESSPCNAAGPSRPPMEMPGPVAPSAATGRPQLDAMLKDADRGEFEVLYGPGRSTGSADR